MLQLLVLLRRQRQQKLRPPHYRTGMQCLRRIAVMAIVTTLQ